MHEQYSIVELQVESRKSAIERLTQLQLFDY